MDILMISSSKDKIDPYYLSLTAGIANFLAKNDCNLVFGASTHSMMGLCYQTFARYDREIYAFTTKKYMEELNLLDHAKKYYCETTFDLKKEMYENSDMIVALPGGIGTLSELASFIEENRSNDGNKPIIIYNEDGFFNPFLASINDLEKKNFADNSVSSYYQVAKNKEEFIELYEKAIEKRKTL